MGPSTGSYIKPVLAYAAGAIAIVGALSIAGSVLFNSTYLINIGSRTFFFVTLADYLSLSVPMIPFLLIPVVAFGLLYISYVVPTHLLILAEDRKSQSPDFAFFYFLAASVVIGALLAYHTSLWLTIALMPWWLVPLTLLLKHRQKPPLKDAFLWSHAVIFLTYSSFFLIILYSELPPLTAVAILLVIVEVWVVFHVYRQSNPLLPLTIYLCHSANLLLFSTVYIGYLEANSDISEDSKLPLAEVHLRDGAILKDMIILRGMERGVLLWDGNGTAFVPWMNVNSLTERANEADSRR